MPKSGSTGIAMPPDFPTHEHNTVLSVVNKTAITDPSHPDLHHFAGAWNAVTLRFKACCDAGESFEAHSKDRTGDSAENAYLRVRTFFEFFFSGFAALDSCAFAIYAIGSAKDKAAFPFLRSGKERGVTIETTSASLRARWPSEALTNEFADLTLDPLLREWGLIRNVLAHRVQPPRTIFMSGRPSEIRISGMSTPLLFHPPTIANHRAWLAGRLTKVISVIEPWVRAP